MHVVRTISPLRLVVGSLLLAAILHVLLATLFLRNNHVDGIKSSTLEESADVISRRETLPVFAVDSSEVFLASLIERAEGSEALVLTTFLLSHYTLEPSQLNKWNNLIDPSRAKEWRLLLNNPEHLSVRYRSNGQREEVLGSDWTCRIRNAKDQRQYRSEGVFMPNRMTKDSNANRRMDVLRCAIEDADLAYNTLARSPTATVQVEIFRGSKILVAFTVPWDTRRTGYLLSSPDLASRFDAWTNQKYLHLCSPGFEFDYEARLTRGVKPGRKAVALYIEFVQHHILLGVNHVFLGVSFGWKSLHMRHMFNALRPYIEEGLLTIVSKSGDSVDGLSSVLGMSIPNVHVENMFATMILYLSKGEAKYLGIWEESDFFIPNNPSATSITSIIERIEITWCSLHFSGTAVFPKMKHKSNSIWAGDYMADTVEPGGNIIAQRIVGGMKVIVDVARAHQCGLGVGAACSYFGKTVNSGSFKNYTQKSINMMTQIGFDKEINIDPFEGVLYSFVTHFDDLKSQTKPYSIALQNKYVSKYFSTVATEITRRGLGWVNQSDFTYDGTGDDIGENTIMRGMGIWIRADGLFGSEVVIGVEEDEDTLAMLKMKLDNGLKEQSKGFSKLPFFASDSSEYFLSSLIERSHDSTDLYLTSFLLCHFMLTPKPFGHKVHAERVSKATANAWMPMIRNIEKVKYSANGQRLSPEVFTCKIRNSKDSVHIYQTIGIFIPNNLSPDSNANRRVDILRCLMRETDTVYRDLKRSSSAEVFVEILRGNQSLIKFKVPWATRRTGYLLSSGPSSSKLDVWKVDPQYLHICVPGLDTVPTGRSLALVAEFIQHHLLLGVDHIYLPVTISWDSDHMKTIINTFSSFINDGSITISSQAGDDIDFVYSFSGMSWGRDNIKNFAANMYLYFSKGAAKYIGIWDFDEFFIPKLPYNSILEVIRHFEDESKYESLKSSIQNIDLLDKLELEWETSPGVADGNPHPWCYLAFSSIAILGNKENKNSLWVGDRFSHGPEFDRPNLLSFKKSILPTARIFQAALHKPGACHLAPQWTSCRNGINRDLRKDDQSLCFGHYTVTFRWRFNNKMTNITVRRIPLPANVKPGTEVDSFHKISLFHDSHDIDEMVLDQDAKDVSMSKVAMFYHVQAHRGFLQASPEALESRNEYTDRFYSKVMEELRGRGIADSIAAFAARNGSVSFLEVTNATPDGSSAPPSRVDLRWSNYSSVFRQRFE